MQLGKRSWSWLPFREFWLQARFSLISKHTGRDLAIGDAHSMDFSIGNLLRAKNWCSLRVQINEIRTCEGLLYFTHGGAVFTAEPHLPMKSRSVSSLNSQHWWGMNLCIAKDSIICLTASLGSLTTPIMSLRGTIRRWLKHQSYKYWICDNPCMQGPKYSLKM